MIKLFLISYDTADGDNLDLFVWAPFSSIAIDFWRQHWEFLADDEQPNAVREIPTQAPAKPCVIDWSDIRPCPA